MNRIILVFLFLISIGSPLSGQVQGIVVERYYVSDSLDSTDPVSGSVLAPGSVTYRIYIDLEQSSSLLGVFGNAGHPLEFRSTAPFFNHASGDVVPYSNTPIAYQEYTLGLDSWITLGQIATRNQSRFCGVLKQFDTDGNLFAGVFNDGGMLNNNDTSAGTPLVQSDGMDTMINMIGSSSWGYNIPPSSVFGPGSADSVLSSTAISIQCDGAKGNDSSNLVLVAQMTTAGEISFRLNLRVLQVSGTDTSVVDYVSELASGETPSSTLVPLPILIYPPVCGCMDARYVEYSPIFTCSSLDSCRNLVRYGCLDTAACNYDPTANYNLPTLCCYPGFCNDRNLEVVCPQLALGRSFLSDVQLGPNPVESSFILKWGQSNGRSMELCIIDCQGRVVRRHAFDAYATGGMVHIDISDLDSGMYMLNINDGGDSIMHKIIKR